MTFRSILISCATLVLATACGAESSSAPAYLQQPDASFAWRVLDEKNAENFDVYELELVSQTWQGVAWTHWMTVAAPRTISADHGEVALLYIDGGNQSTRPSDRIDRQEKLFGEAAARTGTLMVTLRQVPNQPLFEGLREDALIAHSFVRFLETADASWPALLPMTRAAMRAMDAVQAFARDRLSVEIERFVVTGASKRGWTTWLTGAHDGRVAAIAPMVIDTLNMKEQMGLQLEAFGSFSIEIQDYVDQDLPERAGEPLGDALLRLVDPYHQRHRLAIPKLLIIGTNDPYWPVDAAGLYFGDLVGEKLIHYMPNTGHSPGPSALQAISAFYQTVLEDEARPQLQWQVTENGHAATFSVTSDRAPVHAALWSAISPEDRDFRDEVWKSEPIEQSEGHMVAMLELPDQGFVAAYVALDFTTGGGLPITLCTTAEVFGVSLYR